LPAPDLAFLGRAAFGVWKPPQEGLEKLGFPWILSSESSLFNGLHGKFGGIVFVGVRRDIRLGAGGREIVGEAVDLVDQALPLFRAVTVFRYDRVLVLVEPVDPPDCVPPTIAET
jgi:hypothetical protein